MGVIGDKLKDAREERDISLEKISSTTKIDIKYLQALEEENFQILPQPYIRAFLKSYASAVGLSESQIINEYDALKQEVSAEDETSPEKSEYKPARIALLIKNVLTYLRYNIRYVILAGCALVVLLILLVILRPLIWKETPAETTEEAITVDNEGFTFLVSSEESLYLMVSIDNGDSLDYYFPPESEQEFLANEKLWLLTSNAGATYFALNGEKLDKVAAKGWAAQLEVDSTGIKNIKTYQPLSLSN